MTRIEIGIRPALLVACVVLLLVTVGAVSGLGYSGTQAALDQRLTHELEVTKKATTSEVKRLLEPAPKLVRQTEELILKDLISLEDYEHTANILVEHMASYPQIGWLGFAQPERYIGALVRVEFRSVPTSRVPSLSSAGSGATSMAFARTYRRLTRNTIGLRLAIGTMIPLHLPG